MRKFTLSGLPWLSSKPSKKTLACEIDRLNAALSNRQVTINHLERSCTGKDGQLDSLAGTVTHYQRVLAKYDENALAEARRLAVLQILGRGVRESVYDQNVHWLATGLWTEAEAMADFEEPFEFRNVNRIVSGDDGPEPEVGTTTAYAHGYIKGWNTLLDKLIVTISPDKAVVNVVALEQMRKTFNRSEAM